MEKKQKAGRDVRESVNAREKVGLGGGVHARRSDRVLLCLHSD